MTRDLNVKLKEIELRLSELEEQHDNVAEYLQNVLSENDIKVLLNDYLDQKEYLSREQIKTLIHEVMEEHDYVDREEMESVMRQYHITTLKWGITFVFSTAGLVIGIIRIFF
ncbi:MAG: hypothetical protein H0Z32_04905 [Bacillaceae bacterium]|nr:hypothetical protein [Bacillaceae bacterium]